MASDATDIQNEMESTLLPFTVVCRLRIGFGLTYTTSPCCT